MRPYTPSKRARAVGVADEDDAFDVGVALGAADGVALGVGEGVALGVTVGTTVGTAVGAAVGMVVGVAAGVADGVGASEAVGRDAPMVTLSNITVLSAFQAWAVTTRPASRGPLRLSVMALLGIGVQWAPSGEV